MGWFSSTWGDQARAHDRAKRRAARAKKRAERQRRAAKRKKWLGV